MTGCSRSPREEGQGRRPAYLPSAADVHDPDGFDAWLKTNAGRAVPVFLFAELFAIIKQQHGRINALENSLRGAVARVAGLEDARATKGITGVVWGGTFEPDHTYTSGELVTHASNLWVCTCAETSAIPGADPTSWKLVLRRGKA